MTARDDEAAERTAANVSLQGEIHRLHKMIHALRGYIDMGPAEIDNECGGPEPRCGTCWGYGPEPHQARIPIDIGFIDQSHANCDYEKLDAALDAAGFVWRRN